MTGPNVLLYDYPTSICSQMARLCLVEKGVSFRHQTIDIMDKAEQFEPWYTALNPNAVVPTLAIGDEIVTDTKRIVRRIDAGFDGPQLTPENADAARAMTAVMDDVMGLHYGVLLYAGRLDENGTSSIVVARGHFLHEERRKHPERAELLDRRIAGNERLQKLLADPGQIARHIGEARALVGRLDQALAKAPFVAGEQYSLADTFATPALARFRIHGFEHWWSSGEFAHVAGYYQRMRERPSWQAAGVVDTGTERDL